MVSAEENSKNLPPRDLQATKIVLEEENKEALEERAREAMTPEESRGELRGQRGNDNVVFPVECLLFLFIKRTVKCLPLSFLCVD